MTPESVSQLIGQMLINKAWCDVRVRCEDGKIVVLEINQTIKTIFTDDQVLVLQR